MTLDCLYAGQTPLSRMLCLHSNLLRKEQHIASTTMLRHCSNKCWHGRHRAKDFETRLRALQLSHACTATNLTIKCILSFTALILRLQTSAARRTTD